jgi:7-cyano-7-deazaguanine synthase
MQKKAVVVHSGGMDSSLCLALAVKEFGAEKVLSLSFTYNQRHALELDRAQKISDFFKVDHMELNLDCLSQITESALIGTTTKIEHKFGEILGDHLQTIETIIIENQIGPIANKMKTIQALLW